MISSDTIMIILVVPKVHHHNNKGAQLVLPVDDAARR